MINSQETIHTNKQVFKGDVTFVGNVSGAGTTVIANPTGEFDETLSSIQIGNDKYKLGGGGKLYQHNVNCENSTGGGKYFTFTIIDNSNEPYNLTRLTTYLQSNGFTTTSKIYPCHGFTWTSGGTKFWNELYGMRYRDATSIYLSEIRLTLKDDGTIEKNKNTSETVTSTTSFTDTVIEI